MSKGRQHRKSTKRDAYEPSQEEIRLTEALFGEGALIQQHKRSRRADQSEKVVQKNAEEQYLDDDQLFVLDTATAGPSSLSDASESSFSSSSNDENSEEEEIDDDDEENLQSTKAINHATTNLNEPHRKKRRIPAWTDPSIAKLSITIAGRDVSADDGSKRGTNRLRKLREAPDEFVISGSEYELRLRKMYEKLHPRPHWASLDMREASRSSTGLRSIGDLFNTNESLIANNNRLALPDRHIDIERLRDATSSDLSAIETINFHPSARAHVLLTTSKDRRARLIHIDGKDNPVLETLHIPDLPLKNAQFHPSGTSVMLSGPRPFFYVHDVYAGKTMKSAPWRTSSASALHDESLQDRDLTLARFATGKGTAAAANSSKQLAVGVRRGVIHLLDWGNVGGSTGGNLIGTMKMNSPLAGLCWDAQNEYSLISLSTHGSVHSWDVRFQSCQVQTIDSGLFAPRQIECSPIDGQQWAIGSENGIVNVYGRDLVESSSSKTGSTTTTIQQIQPQKSLKNIVTATTSLTFNHSGELLAYASKRKKDTMRLVHMTTTSSTTFENWPTSKTPLGNVSSIAFSRQSEYMALGNKKGKVLLYNLHHYSRS